MQPIHSMLRDGYVEEVWIPTEGGFYLESETYVSDAFATMQYQQQSPPPIATAFAELSKLSTNSESNDEWSLQQLPFQSCESTSLCDPDSNAHGWPVSATEGDRESKETMPITSLSRVEKEVNWTCPVRVKCIAELYGLFHRPPL